MAQTTSRDPRTALVTGASSGLGEEFARQLARAGYGLVLVARRRERLERLAEELSKQHGTPSEVIEADLSQPEGVAAVERRITGGDIEVLVNGAGFGSRGEFAQLPSEREMEEIDVNVRALVRLSHAALGPMIERKRGRIINIASAAGFQPVPYMTTYAATKAFVLFFSEGLHEEAKPHGVTVTALCPGPVRTEFQQEAGVDDSKLPLGWTDKRKVVASALRAAAGGHAVSSPGALNAISTGGVRLMPRFLVRKVAGMMFKRAGV